MITFLWGIIGKGKEITSVEGRRAYGVLCSFVGIGLNVLLFISKLTAGIISGSVAMAADAFNNISDAGASLITLICFKLAGRKPDREHPFGHGRIEYISGLVVSILVILVGSDLLKVSIERIMSPSELSFSWLSFAILVASIFVKLYMASYNYIGGKKINSSAMRATAKDALGDAAATTTVLISLIFFKLTGINIDGWGGLFVAGCIIWSGIQSVKETIGPLLGQAPEEEYVQAIRDLVLSFPGVMDIHRLMVHDYGPGRRYVALHVMLDEDCDFERAHNLAEEITLRLRQELDCDAVVHMDPAGTEDPEETQDFLF